MRNPNSTTTSMTTTSTASIITFQYTSASVCNYDFESVKASYPNAEVVKTNPKTITVTIPVEEGIACETCSSENIRSRFDGMGYCEDCDAPCTYVSR